MKTLIIAEKPSLAGHLKEMLSSAEDEKWEKHDGYFESSKYFLSWFFGHLLRALKPDEMDPRYKSWSIDNLPILPDSLRYEYSDSTIKQGKLLAKLSQRSCCIINATDPDREGQLIFRTWAEKEAIKLPVKRIWVPSLALKDLQRSWSSIKDDAEYDNLSRAAASRSFSDWIVGMNATRAYSSKYGKTIPIGRVLTATLSLIVKRDHDVEHYKESFYYTIHGSWAGIRFTWIDKDGNRKIEDKSNANKILISVKPQLFELSDIKTEKKTENPPRPFSMPILQKVANVKFGFDLDKTLSLAQKLYEMKLITYPRSDSDLLPPADLDSYYAVIDKFANKQQVALLKPRGEPVACVKNSESPHTALIPTGNSPNPSIEADLKILFDLIVERFIVAFMQPRIYQSMTIVIASTDHTMKAIIENDIKKGWTSLRIHEDEDSTLQSDDTVEVQNISIDESTVRNRKEKVADPEISSHKKAKPKYFTPATLIAAMINVGRSVENKEHREILQNVEGLGTAATRDTYPLHLVKYGYISKNGKSLVSTDLGRWVIATVSDGLKSPIATAELESKLRKVEYGTYSYLMVNDEVRKFASDVVENVRASKTSGDIPDRGDGILCPRCRKNLRVNSKCYFCSAQSGGCGFVLWTTIAEKKITPAIVEKLINKGKTNIIKGFKSKKKDKLFDAALVLKDDFTVGFSFE